MVSKNRKTSYFLSTNFTLYPLFSRGMLFTPALELNNEYETQGNFFNLFKIYEHTVPLGALEPLRCQSRNVYPIAIELLPSSIKEVSLVNNTSEFIKLSWVKSLVFQTEKELKRFQFGAYEDVDLAKLDITARVDPSIFLDDLNLSDVSYVGTNTIDQNCYNQFDKMLAYHWGILKFPELSLDWMTFANNELLNKESIQAADDYEILANIANIIRDGTCTQSNWKTKLLQVFVTELCSNSASKGWAPREFLDKNQLLIQSLLQESAADFDLGEYSAWIIHVQGILNQDRQFPDLPDKPDILLRSLILLIVYRTPEALLELRDFKSVKEIGSRVWRLAMIISVSCVGMRALPAKLKFDGETEQNSRLIKYLVEVAITKQKLGAVFSPKISKLSFTPLSGDHFFGANVLLKNNIILERREELGKELTKANNDCIYYNFKTIIVSPTSFKVVSDNGNDLEFPVGVTVESDTLGVNRICFAINLTASRNSIFEAHKKGKRLSREVAEKLLHLNNLDCVNCRVGLDVLSHVWVKSDQLLDTLDADECVAAIRNIQKVSASVKKILI
jgi:hypothetical protein